MLAPPPPPYTGYAVEAYEGVEVRLYTSLIVTRDGGEWPASRTRRSAARC
jgi:hypothetical protein